MFFLSLVALLAEGVDRNRDRYYASVDYAGSPSSRRAWIEILDLGKLDADMLGRPPRGGRG